MDQVEISSISADDRTTIDTHVETLCEMWDQVGEEPLGQGGLRFGDIARLDTLVRFLRWPESGLDDVEKEMLTSCLGYAFGEVLSGELGLEWCKLGGAVESLAMREHEQATDLVLPVEMVVRGFHEGEVDFLRPLFATIKSGEAGAQAAVAE